MTVAQMIVSDVVPLRERGKYQGILGAVVAISNGIGPVIGGVLASRSSGSWRWIFRLNLFLAPATAALVFFLMPLKHVEGYWRLKVRAIDFVGAFLALGGSTLLVVSHPTSYDFVSTSADRSRSLPSLGLVEHILGTRFTW